MVMKRSPRLGTLSSNAVRAALYYARKRRIARINAAVPAPDPHQYWRVLFSDTFNPSFTNIAVAELEFRSSVGGADETSPADAATRSIASSNFSASYNKQHGFNDVIGTANTINQYWAAATGKHLNSWLGWDFGVGNEKDIVQVILTGIADTSQNPLDATVQYSDDGVVWTTAWPITTFASWTPIEVKTLTKP